MKIKFMSYRYFQTAVKNDGNEYMSVLLSFLFFKCFFFLIILIFVLKELTLQSQEDLTLRTQGDS